MEPTSPSQPTNEPNATPGAPAAADPMVSPADADASAVTVNVTPASSVTKVESPADTVSASSSDPVNPTLSSASAAAPVAAAETIGSPVVNGVQQSPAGITASAGGGKKWLVPAIAAGALVALLGVGYVFGMYLPNKPETVFSKSLTQSGLALDKLIDYTEDQAKNPSKSATMDGTMNVKSGETSFDIDMKGKSNATDADMTMDANIMGQKLKADLRMIDAQGSDNPDVYFKLDGAAEMLQSLGAQPAQAAAVEDKWIVADHTLFDSVASQAAGASLTKNPTSEQLNDALAKVQAVNKEYLFTDNAAKGVVQYKSYVGKETKDGRDVKHYKATYSKTNMKAYVQALGKALDESKLNDWYKDQADESFSKSMQLKELEKSIDGAKEGYVFDVYVDAKTKLVQSLVFSDPEDDKSSLTIYQNYTDGSVYPLGLKLTSASSGQEITFDIGMSVDTKTNIVKLDMNAEMGSDGSTGTITGNFTITPSDSDVTVEKPAGATPVTTVMNQLGLSGDSVLGAFTDSPSSL